MKKMNNVITGLVIAIAVVLLVWLDGMYPGVLYIEPIDTITLMSPIPINPVLDTIIFVLSFVAGFIGYDWLEKVLNWFNESEVA